MAFTTLKQIHFCTFMSSNRHKTYLYDIILKVTFPNQCHKTTTAFKKIPNVYYKLIVYFLLLIDLYNVNFTKAQTDIFKLIVLSGNSPKSKHSLSQDWQNQQIQYLKKTESHILDILFFLIKK